jgi:predicted transposase YdaD
VVGVFDTILKQLVASDAPAFAAWLLGTEVAAVETLNIELPAESIRADSVFRVQQVDGTPIILHIEFQGRMSRPSMPWRMLEYMMRLALQHQLPIQSVVLYLDPGAGSQDNGRHQDLGFNSSVVLTWSY